jgi:hypothetical protein
MDVDETVKQSDEDSILAGYGPASLDNQFPTLSKDKHVLKSTFRYNGPASSRHSVLLIQL